MDRQWQDGLPGNVNVRIRSPTPYRRTLEHEAAKDASKPILHQQHVHVDVKKPWEKGNNQGEPRSFLNKYRWNKRWRGSGKGKKKGSFKGKGKSKEGSKGPKNKM